jgi:hypothetical protein
MTTTRSPASHGSAEARALLESGRFGTVGLANLPRREHENQGRVDPEVEPRRRDGESHLDLDEVRDDRAEQPDDQKSVGRCAGRGLGRPTRDEEVENDRRGDPQRETRRGEACAAIQKERQHDPADPARDHQYGETSRRSAGRGEAGGAQRREQDRHDETDLRDEAGHAVGEQRIEGRVVGAVGDDVLVPPGDLRRQRRVKHRWRPRCTRRSLPDWRALLITPARRRSDRRPLNFETVIFEKRPIRGASQRLERAVRDVQDGNEQDRCHEDACHHGATQCLLASSGRPPPFPRAT